MATTIVVAQISEKEVNTRFGLKKAYRIKDDAGTWYGFGFTKPKFGVGDTINCTTSTGSYGEEIDPKSVTVVGGGAATPAAKPAAAVGTAGGGYGGKVFPIPALHGDRSIVRQNALTNARELVIGLVINNANVDMDKITDAGMADRIIAVARKFEAYSCGDLDMEMAKDIAAKAVKAKAKKEVVEEDSEE